MKPIAVLYATREGHTHRIATRLIEALGSAGYAAESANVAKLGDAPDFGRFAAVLLAASVHAGRHEREMVELVKRHRAALERLPTAFISVSLSEAGAEDQSKPPEHRARAAADVSEMIDRFVQETGWHPGRIKPVAGALPYTHYNPFVRLVMVLIARRQGGDTDTSRDYEYTDWDELVAFAQSFAADVEEIGQGPRPPEATNASPWR
jgi:menaquinone-dependent protoporphyrinogen oxidase